MFDGKRGWPSDSYYRQGRCMGISYLQEVILAIYLYPPNPLYLFPAKITAFTVICWPVNLFFSIQGDVRAYCLVNTTDTATCWTDKLTFSMWVKCHTCKTINYLVSNGVIIPMIFNQYCTATNNTGQEYDGPED